jgi:hypothetical protein
VAAGCSDSTSPEDVTAADLVGTWEATAFEVTAVGGGASMDVIALGGSMTLTAGANGAYTIDITFPGELPEVETGTFTVAEGVITIDPEGPDSTMSFDFTLSGNTLTLMGEDTMDLGAGDVPVTLEIVLQRQ